MTKTKTKTGAPTSTDDTCIRNFVIVCTQLFQRISSWLTPRQVQCHLWWWYFGGPPPSTGDTLFVFVWSLYSYSYLYSVEGLLPLLKNFFNWRPGRCSVCLCDSLPSLDLHLCLYIFCFACLDFCCLLHSDYLLAHLNIKQNSLLLLYSDQL